MNSKNKKIALLTAGGTVISETENFFVEQEGDLKGWLEHLPEATLMAEIEPYFIAGEHAVTTGAKVWQKINQLIFDNLKKYDGFIVTSDISQVVYNATAAGLALRNINKPVAFTGSQLPILSKEIAQARKKMPGSLGIKANLINALQVATMEFPAVGLLYGNICLNPAKVRREGVYLLNAFSQADSTYLARIDFGVSPQFKLELPKSAPTLINNFAANVLFLKYYPGMSLAPYQASAGKIDGLIIQSLAIKAFDPAFINELKNLKIPAVVYNRFFVAPLALDNIIEVGALTKEAVIVKFMWALGQSGKVEEIRKIMSNEYFGEFLLTI